MGHETLLITYFRDFLLLSLFIENDWSYYYLYMKVKLTLILKFITYRALFTQ